MALTVLPNMACASVRRVVVRGCAAARLSCILAEPGRSMRSLTEEPCFLACRQQDFFRILTEPEHNMVKQQTMLLATEGVTLTFTEAAIREVSKVSNACPGLLISCT